MATGDMSYWNGTAYVPLKGATGPQGPQGPQGLTGPAGSGLGTNLTTTRDATSVSVNSDTGTDVTIAAADATNAGVMTAAQQTKLAGVATGATANQTDAYLLSRANQTGTQSADTLIDGTTNKAFLATERTKLTGIATGADKTQSALTIPGETTTLVNADTLPVIDSASGLSLRQLSWLNLKANIKAYADTLYAAVTHTHTAAAIVSGVIAAARLGTGTTDATTVLYGDGTWKTAPSGGGGGGAVSSVADTTSIDLTLTSGVLSADLKTGAANQEMNVGSVAVPTLMTNPKRFNFRQGMNAFDNGGGEVQIRPEWGTGNEQVPRGDDARFSDARTPLAHSHADATTSASGFESAADKTKLNGIATGADVTATVLPGALSAATAKTTPVDADTVPLTDSAASGALKKLSWANAKAILKTYFDTLYAAVIHVHSGADLTSGTVGTARLGSGTADSTKFLRGDQTWATPSGGGGSAVLLYADSTVPGTTSTTTATPITGNSLTFTLPAGTWELLVTAQIAVQAGSVARSNTVRWLLDGVAQTTVTLGYASDMALRNRTWTTVLTAVAAGSHTIATDHAVATVISGHSSTYRDGAIAVVARQTA